MHEKWMKLALREAETAAQSEEVPIGCVIVKEDTVVAKAHNLCHKHHDPALHAECIALKQAWEQIGSLEGCTLYVTLEPCAMCAGAMIHYRLPRLVFGAFDPACGCTGSKVDLTDHWFYHSVETFGGILEEECQSLLSAFFAERR